MRTDERRDELVRLLRHRAGWTVERLATEVEASRRTVLRDLAALRQRGFDIPGMAGPGGGVRLEPTSVLVSSSLRTEELVALVLSVAVSRWTASIPFAGGALRALGELEAALPAQRASEVQAFMQRIVVGDPAPGPTDTPAPVDAAFLPLFEQGFTACRVMRFGYVDRGGRRTRREIEPHGLLVRAPHWYAIAWDRRKDEPRLFRADRVRRPTLGDTTFGPRPEDLVTGLCPDARPVMGGSLRRTPRPPRASAGHSRGTRGAPSAG